MARDLIEIHGDVQKIMGLVEDNEGEITDEIEIRLSELQLEAEEKILAVSGWYKRLKMEIAGIEMHKKEVEERYRAAKNVLERLRRWIWKGAKLAGVVRGDEKNGWEGDKIENAQLKLSWRRSEGIETDESAHGFEDLHKNFPELFDFSIRVRGRDAGMLLMDMLDAGLLEMRGREIRKSEAAKLLKSGAMPISGISMKKRINPQIK